MGDEGGQSDVAGGRSGSWFPFRAVECEIALGLIGLVLAGLAAFGIHGREFAVATGGLLGSAYVMGLLAHAVRVTPRYVFLEDGGLEGLGYIPYFRRAERSLFVTHADDDVPAAELLGLYQRLLSRGVAIRRLIFQRPGYPAGEILSCFGEHENLTQRIVPTPVAVSMPLSFAVVDERLVLMSLPGASSLDSESYTPLFLLRHLLVLADSTVARVFLRIHERLWQLGTPVTHGASSENSDR